MMKKRLLASLLTICMLVSLLPAAVLADDTPPTADYSAEELVATADEAAPEDDYVAEDDYKLEDNDAPEENTAGDEALPADEADPELEEDFYTGSAAAETTALSGPCGANVTWKLGDDGTLTVSGSGTMTNYESETNVPWYAYKDQIKTVIIQEGVTSIGKRCFQSCSNLTSVSIAASVTTIEFYAFIYCTGLKTITIPGTVKTIGSQAFYKCTSLRTVTLGNGIQSIGSYAFETTAIRDLLIPASVTDLGTRCIGFSNDNEKKEDRVVSSFTAWVQPTSDAQNYCNSTGVGYELLRGTCGDGVEWQYADDGTITIYGNGDMENYLHSGAVPWNAIKRHIKKLVILDGVTSVGSLCFSGCENLASISIPSSVTSISGSAFNDCTGLKTVTIPGTVKTIGIAAFNNCSQLQTVTLGNGIKTIDSAAFEDTAIKSLTIPSSVTTIGTAAFGFEVNRTTKKDQVVAGFTAKVYNDSAAHTFCKTYGIKFELLEESFVSPFVDVQDPNLYYYKPALWGAENKIVYGTDSTHFSPDDSCTRAQVVTFLYRLAGKPAVSGTNPFTDVSSSEYYYKAVLWGYQNKIVFGTSKTTFSPEDKVTRAQFLTFLYRLEGKPSVSGMNPFTDVPSGEYYSNAVLWGYQNKIVYGTSKTTFGTEEYCTRAQVVTFIYRYAVKYKNGNWK